MKDKENKPVNCSICSKKSPSYDKPKELEELGWIVEIIPTENPLYPEIRILCPECDEKRPLSLTPKGEKFLNKNEK